MPTLPIASGPGLVIVLDYTNQGRVTGFTYSNNTGVTVTGAATLTDGRTFGQAFGQGQTPVNFPNNVVGVTFDAQGEPTFTGLRSFSTEIPK